MTTTATILRRTLTAAIIAGAMMAQASQASAVSLSVQYACMGDYFRYCSKHDPDGPGVRSCMSANGHKLTKTCVNALVKAPGGIRNKVVFVTDSPCVACAKLMINSGVTHVFYRRPYRDPSGIELLARSGITPVHYDRWATEWR